MKISIGARTLVYPCPVFLVGSYDREGRPNVMTVAWGGICSGDPPSVAVSLRKATYSHSCIGQRQAFTVAIAPASLVKEADRVGITSGRDEDKFAATGLSAVRSELVDAPYVAECPVVLECRLAHTFELGLHTQFVGVIVDVKADEAVLGPNRLPDILRVQPLVYSSSDKGYYGIGPRVATAFSVGKPR